ncbi:DUF4442 domain-containing protein [Leptospira langatensis]|uniref:DUF4442 domain-containing protein n=1 Tax=Leptospira langatensis TaxID=2484983 RepID=A0A5F1ZT45_9LEPT|nr:DUF4442 domain-containing protein [Leptospira langatensis]TGK02734.1 DUF4442 domain-containing protein [Leptospira langatensis]TGL40062.1 DUF4442 domain-containing protein [Leptospira langatensis]
MKLYKTDKKESLSTWWLRLRLNYWPCIWCTGGKIQFISSDYKELHVGLKKNLRTLNRVGTIYGGSIYSSVDPYFMLLMMWILGPEYVVWDKAAKVKFVRPIVGKVKAKFLITEELIERTRQGILEKGEIVFDLPVKYEDEEGKVYATFEKTIYAASKEFYEKKLASKNMTSSFKPS